MRKIRLVLAVLPILILLGSAFTNTAHADPGGVSQGCGYFNTGDCGHTSGLNSVINGGIDVPADKGAFISAVEGLLTSGNTRWETGGAFIIQTMRGSSSRNRPPTAGEIQDWKDRINAGPISISRENYSYDWNSGYVSSINDDSFYQESGTEDSYVFRNNGTIVFAMKINCGNVIGDLPGLPGTIITPPPPPAPTPPPPPPPGGGVQPRGVIDHTDCSYVGGWAYDPDSPNTAIGIHVRINSTTIDIGATNYPSPDINNNSGAGPNPPTSGNHRFQWSIPAAYKDGVSHSYQMYARGVDGSGSGGGSDGDANNPQITAYAGSGTGSFTCGGSTPPPPPAPTPPPPPPPPVGGSLNVTVVGCTSPPNPPNQQTFAIDWSGNGSSGWKLQIDDDGNWGNGYWQINFGGGTTSYSFTGANTSAWNPVAPKTGSLVIYDASTYTIRIISNADGSGRQVSVGTQNCNTPPPPPPAPIVTPTCTAGKPTFDISWGKAGKNPTSFTVDLDNDSYAGGWLYKDVSSSGAGPFSANSAPSGFTGFGTSPPGIPLNAGVTYQVRINYRQASFGIIDVFSGVATPTTRSDCGGTTPTPPAPTLTPTCTANQPTFDISWNAVGGLSPTSFTVDFDDNSFAGGWLYKDVSSAGSGPYSATSAPSGFTSFGASPPGIPLNAGATYQARINYRAAAGGSDVFSLIASNTTRNDCAPTPPSPTVTPTCTSGKPTFDISWNAVGGLSPTSFTTDFDNDSFAGGTNWLYKDTSSAGPGPYSITAAPNGFSSFGSGPGVPLNAAATYQVRINYRGAGSGGTDVKSVLVSGVTRNDCAPTIPPPPTVTPTCTSFKPTVDISWNASPGLSPSSFTTDFDNDSFAGGWLYKDTSSAGPGPYSITAAPNGFSSFGSGPGVPLNPGTTYQVRINYRAAAAGSDVQSTIAGFTARNDCGPPTPAAPGLTATCTANKPTVDISWNAVGGLSPTSFTTDFDDNSFAGGTNWLYKDTSSAGPGPYSITAAPNGFSSFGSGPGVPLNPGTTYQVRINYRAAAAGSDVQSATGTFTARNDCVPPPTLSCSSFSPTGAEPGAPPFTMTAVFANAAASTALTGAGVQIVVGATAYPAVPNAVTPDPLNGGASGNTSASIGTLTAGTYPVALKFTGGNVAGGTFTAPCAVPLSVANRPYFRTYGGDVTSGIKNPVCPGWTPVGNTTINAYNDLSGKGSAVQLAAFALGQIDGLSTGTGTTHTSLGNSPVGDGNVVGKLPKYLTFANAGSGSPGTSYGGGGGVVPCPYDYYGNKPASAAALGATINSFGPMDGSYYHAGNLDINSGAPVNTGKRIAIYVSGDVTISRDIQFNTGAWSIGSIPSLYIIARGNIYVSPSVHQIDGVFVAQPNAAGVNGRFYSCANNAASVAPPVSTVSSYIATNCDSKLDINGVVIAQKLRLFRIHGSLFQSSVNEASDSGTIAEMINDGPETWLTIPAPFTNSPINGYDAITGLPPVL